MSEAAGEAVAYDRAIVHSAASALPVRVTTLVVVGHAPTSGLVAHVVLGGVIDEAHLSAERPQTVQEARLSQANVHEGGSFGAPRSAAQGPGTPVGVICGIRRRETFALLRSQGVRVRRRDLSVMYLMNASPDTEVAFAISRRDANAVRRNRCRRRMRAALGELARQGALPTGAYLMSVGRGMVDAPFSTWSTTLDDVARQLMATPR